MRARHLAIIGLVAASGALALCCAEVPPRRSGEFYGPQQAAQVPEAARGSSGVPNGAPPNANAGPRNPFEPKAPPPVPAPDGQGNSVRLQKLMVVDQFGYRPAQSKVAVLVSPEIGWDAGGGYTPNGKLEVKRWSDGRTVFEGPVSAFRNGALDERSGDRGSWFDFSTLREPGTYYLFDARNVVRSHPFEIADDVYRKVLKTATRMYYFNRANFEKKPPYSCVGKRCWSIAADYLGPGQDREARSVRDRNNAKTARDLSGGWWDAGDTNKYVTFSGAAVHPLLTAYEEHPTAFGDDFGIPESGNGTPDLIDEILVELRWLEKMQPTDLKGGALLKVGVVDYGEPRPDQSKLKRFYYPEPCSAATITVAGEFAHAAVVLKKLGGAHATYAAQLSNRAKNAWDYYHSNPKSDSCDDGSIKSGDCDASLPDQDVAAVVAGVYLFELTGDARYDEFVKKNFRATRPFRDDRWSLYEPTQGDALLHYAGLPNADPATKTAILERKKANAESADFYKFEPSLDLYRAYMHADSYHWGSSVRAAYGNNSYDLVQYGLATDANRMNFVERAAGMLHSFHGVNPMQLVYLTNMYADGGDACADETYHAWFRDQDPQFDNARTSTLGPAPGYLTGGPNRQYCEGQDPKQFACGASAVRNQPPEKAFVDSNTGWEPFNPYDRSWELNEPAIYYQAGYV